MHEGLGGTLTTTARPRIVGLSMFVFVTLACGNDDVATGGTSTDGDTTGAPSTSASGTTDMTTTGATATTDTTEAPGTEGTSTTDTTDASTGPGDSDTGDTTADGGGSSTDQGSCVPLSWEAVKEPAFTGDDGCAGVQHNAVLDDASAVADHHAAWCSSVESCVFPEPPCPTAPELPEDDERIVYVFGITSGCSAAATIEQILDCGETIEVHHFVAGIGECGAIRHAWASAAIPDDSTPVVFVGR